MSDFFDAVSREALRRRLRTLHFDTPRRWGRMTAHQMVCHLSDAFRLPLGDRPARRRDGPLARTLLRWWAFHLPLPWPRSVRTVRELDQERDGTRPEEFAADLAKLESLMDRFGAAGPALDGVAHTMFGPLTHLEWGRWGYRHVDHHLRQFGL